MSKSNYEIVDIFESIKNDIFIPQSYISINKNLKNFSNYKISISVPLNGKDLGFDVNLELVRLLKNEINQNIYKTILKDLFSTSKFDYVDISKSVNIHTSFNDIIDFLVGVRGYKYLITNTATANSLGDSSRFHFNLSNQTENNVSSVIEFNGIPYKFGCLSGYDVYLDPYMKYDDNRICLFNECEINIENLNHSIIAGATFAPKMVISYDLAYKVGDSKVIFVLDGDESSTSYKQYKQLQRDIKIDSLLDGSTNQ